VAQCFARSAVQSETRVSRCRSTRPFLRTIEKKWIAYQLLRALDQAHGQGVCHGDIKAENVMVTSWNWIYLTDFATAFKPAIISEVIVAVCVCVPMVQSISI
jgi:RIO-like serine/threonine protein kinase